MAGRANHPAWFSHALGDAYGHDDALDTLSQDGSDRPSSTCALYAFINGRSQDHDSNRIVFLYTNVRLASLACDVWYDYVPSAANAADLPTRLDAGVFGGLNALRRGSV